MPTSKIDVRLGHSRQLRFTSNVLRTVGILSDAICFALAYVIAVQIYHLTIGQNFDGRLHVTGAIVMAINFFLIRISGDSYSVFKGQADDVGRSTLADFMVAATLTALMIIQFGMLKEFSRGLGLIFIGCCLCLLFLNRITFRRITWSLADRGVIGQRMAVYGASAQVTSRVIELVELERLPHVRLVGYADDRKREIEQGPGQDVPYLGGFADMLNLGRNGLLDQVIVALPDVTQERLDNITEELSAASIDVCIMPRELLELRKGYRLNFLGSLPVFSIWQQPIRDMDGVVKFLLDRSLALLGIILLLPLLALTALAIKLESKGPVIFSQKRFGFNNLEIDVYKFRSMRIDMQDVTGAARTTKDDPRVTRIGRIIRRLSIDELPQLFNVLKGDMSLVGPRPHATMMRVEDKYYFDAVQGYVARHRVKPGITGLAQVRGLRGEIATLERAKKRVEYDIYYIENWSPLLDIRIIFETVFKLIWDKDAY